MKHYKHYWLSLVAITFIAIGCDESGTTQDDSSTLPDSTTCTNGTWNCDDNELFKCISNHWETIKTCGDGMTCNAETAECEPKTIPEENGNCTNDDWKCYNNELFKCISNHWETIKTCSDGTTCNEQTASCIKTTNPDIHCLTNEHLFAGRCEPDDVNHCGSHLNDCTKISGWKSGDCIDKVCFSEECAPDYHLASLVDDGEEKTICEGDTKDACGSINTKCRDDEVCVQGKCACPMGKALCQGSCIDVQSDSANCGACDNACDIGLICSAGQCVGSTLCNGRKHDTQSDLDHCGACNNRCPDGKICKDGQCTSGVGWAYCDDVRVWVGTLDRCASCTDRCADGLTCKDGKCVAEFGSAYCNDEIVEIGSDVDHCSSCNDRCPDGKICKDGQCTNGVGKAYCDGVIVEIGNSVDRCTGCNRCPEGKICKDGSCTDGVGRAYCDDMIEEISNSVH